MLLSGIQLQTIRLEEKNHVSGNIEVDETDSFADTDVGVILILLVNRWL
jgi:hypothetical protein